MDEVQGLRRVRNRSLFDINEDFELKCNVEIRHLSRYKTRITTN